MSSQVLAQEPSNADQTQAVEPESAVAAPDLAQIIPKAAKLSGELAILENRVRDVLDVLEIEKKYAGIEKSLKDPVARLQQVKDTKDVRLKRLEELRKVVERENELFEEVSRPLNETIRQFGAWRNDWQAEKQRWNEWESILLEDGDFAQLQSTFEMARDTIDKALKIVNSQLGTMLAVQDRAGDIQAKIITLAAEFDSLILGVRFSARVHTSPPMYSSRYFSQFSNELWYAVQKGVDQISWPDSLFFDQYGLILFFLVILSI
jgi:hypothetical protein